MSKKEAMKTGWRVDPACVVCGNEKWLLRDVWGDDKGRLLTLYECKVCGSYDLEVETLRGDRMWRFVTKEEALLLTL